MKVVQYPDPSLATVCEPVIAFDAELAKLLEDLVSTMFSGHGVGLAANQVGVHKRMFVMRVKADGEDVRGVFNAARTKARYVECINPEIRDLTGSVKVAEGCLSFGDVSAWIARGDQLTLAYQDRFGAHHERHLQGIEAICAQHEVDHLDGITFVDRMTSLTRRVFLREYERQAAYRAGRQPSKLPSHVPAKVLATKGVAATSKATQAHRRGGARAV